MHRPKPLSNALMAKALAGKPLCYPRKRLSISMNNSNAAAWRMTRQRINWFDRLGSVPPRATPIRPANNTPTVANMNRPIRKGRKWLTGVPSC